MTKRPEGADKRESINNVYACVWYGMVSDAWVQAAAFRLRIAVFYGFIRDEREILIKINKSCREFFWPAFHIYPLSCLLSRLL